MSTCTLYHTDGCHLCEQAMALLVQCQVNYNLVDIMTEQRLIDSFGTCIPVLENAKGQYLNWPFAHQQIEQFLAA